MLRRYFRDRRGERVLWSSGRHTFSNLFNARVLTESRPLCLFNISPECTSHIGCTTNQSERLTSHLSCSSSSLLSNGLFHFGAYPSPPNKIAHSRYYSIYTLHNTNTSVSVLSLASRPWGWKQAQLHVFIGEACPWPAFEMVTAMLSLMLLLQCERNRRYNCFLWQNHCRNHNRTSNLNWNDATGQYKTNLP